MVEPGTAPRDWTCLHWILPSPGGHCDVYHGDGDVDEDYDHYYDVDDDSNDSDDKLTPK